jgi:hypothetical protein
MTSFRKNAAAVDKPLRLGIGAFAVGVLGVALGFAIDYGPNEPLSFVVFGLVAVAIITVFVAIAWGLWSTFRQ